ncbi:MAG: Clp protease N-terminal domain-containing protein [Acidimicrobiales bacterium]|jgi:ATP-dependent Clp protease ATP-binding subunit ClpA
MDALNGESEKVLAIARQEAAGLHHEFTGTEHILLGLLACDDEIAAPLLSRHGVVSLEVRTQVARQGVGSDASESSSQPLTARAKQVLALANREAEDLDDAEVGPEHLLLGIIRQASGVAALVLQDMGVDLGELRSEVLEAREANERLLVGASVAADASRSEEARRVGQASRVGLDATVGATLPELDVQADGSPAPVTGFAHPLCPGCGQRLNDVLATVSVSPEGSVGFARRRGFGPVTLIYCGACGHTLAASR